MPKIKCEVEISRSRLADVLCAGLEGGISYWADISEYVSPPEGADLFADLKDWGQGDGVFKHIHFPMCEAGGGVRLVDCTGDDNFPGGAKPVLLNYPALLRGLQQMAEQHPRHFTNIVEESEDADTGDCLIQLAVFGELVFG